METVHSPSPAPSHLNLQFWLPRHRDVGCRHHWALPWDTHVPGEKASCGVWGGIRAEQGGAQVATEEPVKRKGANTPGRSGNLSTHLHQVPARLLLQSAKTGRYGWKGARTEAEAMVPKLPGAPRHHAEPVFGWLWPGCLEPGCSLPAARGRQLAQQHAGQRR